MSMGTQPMPPSDRAIARSGKRSGTPDHSHSAAATSAFTGNRVGSSSKGGSGEGSGAHEEAPVCRQTTVAVSSQAANRGSQWPVKMEGRPSWAGNSGKLSALKPRPALARTSAAATATSPSQVSWSGMIRSGWVPAHTSWCQSFHARMAGQPELGVGRPGEHRTAESGDQGREAQRGPDARSVHVGHPGLDVEAARTHLVEARRLHAPLVPGPPDHRVEADVRIEAALVLPGLGAAVELDAPWGAAAGAGPGIRPSNRSGGSIRWSSTEMIGTITGRGSGSASKVPAGTPEAVGPSGRGVPRRPRHYGAAHRSTLR